MFEPKVFRMQMCSIEKSWLLVTLLGFFGAPGSDLAPHSDSAPGRLYFPLVTPLTVQYLVETLLSNLRRG